MNKLIGITDLSFHIVMNTQCYGVEFNKYEPLYWLLLFISYHIVYIILFLIRLHTLLCPDDNVVINQLQLSSLPIIYLILCVTLHSIYKTKIKNKATLCNLEQVGTNKLINWIEIISEWSHDDLDSRMFCVL